MVIISAEMALLILDLQVAQTKGEALKESTKKSLLTQLKTYEKFCNTYKLQYFPCDNQQLCRFGQHLSGWFESADAVGNYILGIRTCMALLGLEIPSAQDRQM